MNTQAPLPKDFYLLNQPGFADPDDPDRPNRLCICFSDVHFTDGTVGNQSADSVVWENVFNRIQDLCTLHNIQELTLLLVGDVADMIRTAEWSENGVYPWERDDSRFNGILQKIMQGIIDKHSGEPKPCDKPGFFYWLKKLPQMLEKLNLQVKVQTLVLLGNHDKEMFADDATLKMFYEQCLGQPVPELTEAYRRWVGKMYFGDENHYLDDTQHVPWLPFYWADRGFRLFVTHGQWRDQDNSRVIKAQGPLPGWQVSDGWNLDTWRQLKYAPFTAACFGDTVAAGVLSGFIYTTKKKLNALIGPTQSNQQTTPVKVEIERLCKTLDELDLYRPTYAAVGRIIKDTWRLRKKGKEFAGIRKIIEDELLNSIHTWLGWDFTLESATPTLKIGLRIAKPIVSVMSLLGSTIELGFLYLMMWGMTQLKQGVFNFGDAPSYKDMKKFPTFLEAYRDYGFRIHGEGHTHIPLQEELYFKQPDKPEDRKSYTYINFGTWRDQIVIAQKGKYRRRGVGRALCVLDLVSDTSVECIKEKDLNKRGYAYWIEDILTWGDHFDRF
ncbi:hypothetical protein [Methylovulum miyakonense]|uniref:hypothetical protein n=1 Tax=Methylovulum miyakonense TaxID=645578 RepID=UPI000371FC85|nr:hypothetical protein [Methylovulum miyakonense]